MMKKAILAAAALALALTACSQTGAGLPLSGGSAGPVAAGDAAAKRKGRLQLAIKVPKKPRHPRGTRYVSAYTKSMEISLAPAGGGQTIVKKVNITGSSLEITIPLNPGKYLANVSTYDKLNEAGNVLSAGQALPFTIVAGQDDPITLTLGGVAHSYLVEAETAGGSAAAGFTTAGATQQAFDFVALDADGGIIIGAGTPTYDLSISGTGWSISPKQVSSTTEAGRFVITPPNVNNATASVKIAIDDPGLCALSGSACTTTFGLKNVKLQLLYVAVCAASCNASWGPDAVDIFAYPYTGGPIAQITNGVQSPHDVAVDKAGNVFVLNVPFLSGQTGNPSVTEYSPSNSYAAPIATMTTGFDPWSKRIALDQQDDVIVMEGANDTYDFIGIYAAASHYAAAPTLIKMQLLQAVDMVVNAQGTIVIAQCGPSCNHGGKDGIAQFPQPYTSTEVPTFIQDVDPLSLTIDPVGNLWVGECEGCTVQASDVSEHLPIGGAESNLYSPTITNMADETNYIDGPVAIAVDANKNLFISDAYGSAYPGLNEYASPYTVAPTVLFSGAIDSLQMAIDSQGVLVMNSNEDELAISAPPYSSYTSTVVDYGFPVVLGQEQRFTLGAAP